MHADKLKNKQICLKMVEQKKQKKADKKQQQRRQHHHHHQPSGFESKQSGHITQFHR